MNLNAALLLTMVLAGLTTLCKIPALEKNTVSMNFNTLVDLRGCEPLATHTFPWGPVLASAMYTQVLPRVTMQLVQGESLWPNS
jgi:hypothetical protein